MTDTPRTYRAIFFDLDGTLLPMDLDAFLHAYYKRLLSYAAVRGWDAERFRIALDAGISAMVVSDGTPNKQAFWESFGGSLSLRTEQLAEIEKMITAFYQTDFCRVGDKVVPNPAARQALETLAAKGYPLVLATMPLFPRLAVDERLRWAGVDSSLFVHVTTYENATSVKPKREYYEEIVSTLGLKGEDVLMVGNNTEEDLAAQGLGCDAYLVTDWLLDPIGFDLSQVKHGSMEDFLAWSQGLPRCPEAIL